jgi:hypothetical protein
MQLKTAVDEQVKRFWSDVGARIGKSGNGCERIAKEELKLKVTIEVQEIGKSRHIPSCK